MITAKAPGPERLERWTRREQFNIAGQLARAIEGLIVQNGLIHLSQMDEKPAFGQF